jgi:PAS domain S-box-containing protein
MKSAARQFFHLIARRAKLRSLLVLALVPGLGALALVAHISYRNGQAEFESSTLHSAQILMQAVDSEFSGDQLALQALASSTDLRENNLASFYREAVKFTRSAPAVSHIVLTDANGQQLLNSLVPFGSPLPKTQNMDRVRQLFATGKPSISDLIQGTLSKQWSITLDVPVVRDGKTIYALSMVLKAERMQQILVSLGLDGQWSASIFDRNGTIVGRLRNPETNIGRPAAEIVRQFMRGTQRNGLVEGMTQEGLHVWGAVHRSPSTGYAVTVSLPYAHLQDALWRSVATASLAAIVLMIICMAFAWRFAEQILGSVNEITRAAADAEKGELNITLDRKGPVEFIEMAEQFERMLKAVRASDATQRRMNRALRLLTECTEAMARASDEQAFMDAICRLIVESGGYKMAWIGFAEHDLDKTVRPAAWHGDEDGYLSSVRVQNFRTNPDIQPWRDALSQRGYQSSIGLPLLDGGHAFGALTIYAIEPDAFEPDEVHLLQELASNVAFGILSLRSDIVREAAEAQLRKLSQAVEQSPESIVITDLEGRIEYVNQAFLRITGYRHEEVIGQNPNLNAAARNDPAAYADLWSTLRRGETWKGQFISHRKDGTEFVEFAVIGPIRDDDGRITHYLSIKEDITEKSRLADELEQHRHHLEDLVSERTQALLLALQQAESANRAKSTFLSNMSHELRTPLNSVIGFARLMAKSERLNDNEKKNLEIISRAGNHLLTLINDVLELAKIESGQVSVSDAATDVAALVHEVVDMLRPRAEQGGLALDVRIEGVPNALHTDTVKLRQILINLLSNALKFTRQGSVALTVRGARVEHGNSRLEFEIRDSGIGIDPADQQRIFEPFVQAVTHATSAGTGLGLPITQRYLRMMGSELTLESAPGAGSVFRFSLTLPVVDAMPQPIAARGTVTGLRPADWGKRVLIIEDNEDARLLVEQLLTPLGFAVVHAEDGEAGVRKAAEFGVDLVLTDWRMPKMDGLEAAHQIRRLALARQPKILMLTASAFEEQKQLALATDIDDFLRKPFQEDELFDAIERHLEIRFVRKGGALAGAPAPVTSATEKVTPEEMQTLLTQQFAQLKTAVEELNQNKLNAVLTDIEQTNPGLAFRLRAMARSFRYAELWAALGGESVNPIESA